MEPCEFIFTYFRSLARSRGSTGLSHVLRQPDRKRKAVRWAKMERQRWGRMGEKKRIEASETKRNRLQRCEAKRRTGNLAQPDCKTLYKTRSVSRRTIGSFVCLCMYREAGLLSSITHSSGCSTQNARLQFCRSKFYRSMTQANTRISYYRHGKLLHPAWAF